VELPSESPRCTGPPIGVARHGDRGEAFSYSDTGYVLLGEIVERSSGTSLGDAYAELLDFRQIHQHPAPVPAPISRMVTAPEKVGA
jgi:CubicO group peptidase (beta-lactamase class C family)